MNLTVNGEAVSQEAVEREYQRLLRTLGSRVAPEDLSRRRRQLQRRALDHAVGRLLLLAEARRRAIRVAPEEIDEAVAALVRACGGAAGFRAHLQALKLSLDDLRRRILEARQTERLVAQVTADSAAPTEDEISAYLNEHAHEFLGGEDPTECKPAMETLRKRVRELLAAAGKDKALSAFIAKLKTSAIIKEEGSEAKNDK